MKRGVISLLIALSMALAMLSTAVAASAMLPAGHDCRRSRCAFRKGIQLNLPTLVEAGHMTPADAARIRMAIAAGQVYNVMATGTGANIGVLRSGVLHAKRDTMKAGGEPAREVAGFIFLVKCDNLWKPDKPAKPVVKRPPVPPPAKQIGIAVARVRYSSGGTTAEASATAIATGSGSAAAATSQVTNITNNFNGDQAKEKLKQDEPTPKTPVRDVEGAGTVRYGTSGGAAVSWEEGRSRPAAQTAYKAGIGPLPRGSIDSTPGVKIPVYTSVAAGPINQGPNAPPAVVGTTSGGHGIGTGPGVVAPGGTDSTIGTGPSPR